MCQKTTKRISLQKYKLSSNILNIGVAFRTLEPRTYADINSHLFLQQLIKALKHFPEHNTIPYEYVVRNTVATVLWDRSSPNFTGVPKHEI
jgi:hypothetical protein